MRYAHTPQPDFSSLCFATLFSRSFSILLVLIRFGASVIVVDLREPLGYGRHRDCRPLVVDYVCLSVKVIGKAVQHVAVIFVAGERGQFSALSRADTEPIGFIGHARPNST